MVVPPQVLVVESDRELLDIFTRSLVRFGCQVTPVYQPQCALQEVEARDFDAVIVDHVLAGTDGIRLIERLRSRRAELPVILLSVSSDTLAQEEARTLGVFEVIPKPCRLVRLEDAVERAVEHSRRWLPSETPPLYAWR